MRKWWRKASFFLLCAAVIESAAAGAAFGQVGIQPSHPAGSQYKIVVTGRIDATTLMEFSRAVIDPRIADTDSPSVELDSHGGSVLAAMAIGDLVRRGGFDTHVSRRHTCDSACVLILAAGVERHAAPGSVTIHRPKVAADQPPDRARARYAEAIASMRHYLRDMGMRDRLLDAMLAVPSDRLRTLSQDDMEAFGLAEKSAGIDMPGRAHVRPVPQINGRAETAAQRCGTVAEWAWPELKRRSSACCAPSLRADRRPGSGPHRTTTCGIVRHSSARASRPIARPGAALRAWSMVPEAFVLDLHLVRSRTSTHSEVPGSQ